jgi:hypothetical protein
MHLSKHSKLVIPDLTIPEIIDAINPPYKAIGIGYFASSTLHKMNSGNQEKAYLRLNIRPGSAHLVNRGYLALHKSGLLDMTHARLQSLFEYRVCEGHLISTVQRMRLERKQEATTKRQHSSLFENFIAARNEKLSSYAIALSRARRYPVKHAAIAMRYMAKEVAEAVGCNWQEVVKWSEMTK